MAKQKKKKPYSKSKGRIGGQACAKDSATTLIFMNDRNFVEVFNRNVFKEDPIRLEELRMDDRIKETSLIRVSDGGHMFLTRYRDCVRGLGLGQMLGILGLENQSQLHYQMPLRLMENDLFNYRRQVNRIADEHKREAAQQREEALEQEKMQNCTVVRDFDASESEEAQRNDATHNVKQRVTMSEAEYLSRFRKEDRILPCINLVIYWGEEPWSGPTKLSEMFVESKWTKFASDYEIRVLDVKRLSPEELEAYDDELRTIFGFIKYANQKEELMQFIDRNETAFERVSDTAFYAIAELTHSPEIKRLMEKNETTESEEGGINMCQALREMMEDARAEERKKTEAERKKTEAERKKTEEERKRANQQFLRAETAMNRVRELEAEVTRLRRMLQPTGM